MNKEQLKKKLIDILDQAVVPYKNWYNRDTPSAQEWCAKMRMYLLAGCDFKLMSDYWIEVPKENIEEYLKDTKIDTMYLSIFHYEFEDDGTWHTSYIPSLNRLKISKWKDWY